MLQALQQAAVGVEDFDKAEARAAYRVVLGGILLGIRHVDIRSDSLHIERSKAISDSVVVESIVVIGAHPADLLEVGVKNINPAAAKIRGQDESVSIDLSDGRTFVDCSIGRRRILGIVDFDHRGGWFDSRIPTLHRAIFCYENENRPLAWCKKKISRAPIEHHRGWRSGSGLAGSIGNRNNQRNDLSGAIVQSGSAARIIGHPPRTGRAGDQSPGLPQMWINDRRTASDIGNQWRRYVMLAEGWG